MTPRNPLYGSLPTPIGQSAELIRLCPRQAILPAPPSVNEAYRNSSKSEIALGHRGRRKTDTYKSWIKAAGLMLNAARLGNFASPVSVLIRVGKCNQARDLDNFNKAVCDLLVHCGVIKSDNLTVVHSVSAVRSFGDVPAGMVAVSVDYIQTEDRAV